MTPEQQLIREETRLWLVGEAQPMTWKEAAEKGVTNLGSWMRLLGYRRNSTVMTLYPYIIHPGHVDLSRDWPLAAHERVHWERQKPAKWSWLIKYALLPKFRAIEEMHAHLVDLRTGRWADLESGLSDTRKFHKLGCVDRAWMREWMLCRLPPNSAP